MEMFQEDRDVFFVADGAMILCDTMKGFHDLQESI